MSENDSDADRFFREAEEYFYRVARERGLGFAAGYWKHPRHGDMLVRAVFGQVGQLYVTLVFCASRSWLDIGQARLWWYLNDYTEPFEFKHISQRSPMAERIINWGSDLDEEIGARLQWLEKQPSIESALGDIFGNVVILLRKIEEAQDDVRIALAGEIPKGDEGEDS